MICQSFKKDGMWQFKLPCEFNSCGLKSNLGMMDLSNVLQLDNDQMLEMSCFVHLCYV